MVEDPSKKVPSEDWTHKKSVWQQAGCEIRSIFKQCKAGLNLQVSFS